MQKLKIPKSHSGISKTLRLPENLVKDIQNLAEMKNISFNKYHLLLSYVVSPNSTFRLFFKKFRCRGWKGT